MDVAGCGVGIFENPRERLACWVALPTIRARDSFFLGLHAFSVRCGPMIVAEVESRSIEELFAAIENFYSPTASEMSDDVSHDADHT